MEYLPNTGTIISLVLSVGTAFIIGKQVASIYNLSTYAMILIQVGIVAPLYYAFSYGTMALYSFVTGYKPQHLPPQPSVTPNIQMFPNQPQVIPTNVGPSSRALIPMSGGTTATPNFGTSFLMTINTTVANPAPDSPSQLDYAPLVDFHSVPAGSSAVGQPVLTFGYMPEGNLLQAIFFEGGSGDSLDIPTGDAYDTRVTIGTPPVRKSFSIFLRTRPASPNYTTVEVYINGVLGKTTTVRSLFFGGIPGGIIPRIGYKADKNSYPAVDAEIQSLMVWGDASALTLKDIQALATQQIASAHQSRHVDTTRCK
jgi:hypothetical protein